MTQKVGGDTTATYALETGDCSGPESKQYTGFDIAMWDWVGYIDPDFMLSVVTKRPVVLVERYGREQPGLRQALRPAGQDGRPGEAHGRSSTPMQKIIYDNFYYTQLVERARDRRAREELDGLRPAS